MTHSRRFQMYTRTSTSRQSRVYIWDLQSRLVILRDGLSLFFSEKNESLFCDLNNLLLFDFYFKFHSFNLNHLLWNKRKWNDPNRENRFFFCRRKKKRQFISTTKTYFQDCKQSTRHWFKNNGKGLFLNKPI